MAGRVSYSRDLIDEFGLSAARFKHSDSDGYGVLRVRDMRRELCARVGVDIEREALRRRREELGGSGEC